MFGYSALISYISYFTFVSPPHLLSILVVVEETYSATLAQPIGSLSALQLLLSSILFDERAPPTQDNAPIRRPDTTDFACNKNFPPPEQSIGFVAFISPSPFAFLSCLCVRRQTHAAATEQSVEQTKSPLVPRNRRAT